MSPEATEHRAKISALFTNEQWYALCDLNMSLPVELHTADLDKPFVYDRNWGLFYVQMGYHRHAMALLLAFRHGYTNSIIFAEDIGVNGYDQTSELADSYLMGCPGTAFLSSVGSSIIVGRRGHLDSAERQVFRGIAISYLDER